jgi:hypothetical protein
MKLTPHLYTFPRSTKVTTIMVCVFPKVTTIMVSVFPKVTRGDVESVADADAGTWKYALIPTKPTYMF